MPWREIGDRGRQEWAKLWDGWTGGWSVRRRARPATRFSKDDTRRGAAAGRFFFDRDELDPILAALREHCPAAVADIVRRADRVLAHEFDLLGYEGLRLGPGLDWRRDPVHDKPTPLLPWRRVRLLDFGMVGDGKITAELNRHQHLVVLAKAYALTREARYAAELTRQWRSWQRDNPYPRGINWASSLEVAFRSLAWIWAWRLLDFAGGLEPAWERDLVRALGLNAAHIERFLSTYTSPNTHLQGEAVGLFFIGTMCPWLPAAPRWRDRGWRILLREAERQVQADGMHFEQSLYYHVYALDFFLHARILADRNGVIIPPEFDAAILRMLEALRLLTQAGPAPRFGDDDGGRVLDGRRNRAEHMRDPLAAGAVLFARPELKTAAGGLNEETLWLLGPSAVRRFALLPLALPAAESRHLEASGLVLMAGRAGRDLLLMDAGALGAGNGGHGHADALSVELMAYGRRWLVDPGTYVYLSPGGERDQFRGTAAHNTLQVDDCDQAEPAGPFAWRALPRTRVAAWGTGEGFRYARASHDGYRRLAAPVLHERRVFHLPDRFWMIVDRALGEGGHQLALRWHLDPEIAAARADANRVLLQAPGGERMGLTVAPDGDWSLEVEEGSVSPAYGRREPASVVRVAARGALPRVCATLLQPLAARAGERAAPWASLTRLPAGAAAWGWECALGDERHAMVFAASDTQQLGDALSASGCPLPEIEARSQPDQREGGLSKRWPSHRWQAGPWSGDAEFFYCGPADRGQWRVVMCAGSELRWNGEPLLRAPARLAAWEAVAGGGAPPCAAPGLNRELLAAAAAAFAARPAAVVEG